jgi:arsenical pump membrane protein
MFRAELEDEAPAKGPRLATVIPRGAATRVVAITLVAVLGAYPVMSLLGGPLWLVALAGAVTCVAVSVHGGIGARAVARSVSWEILPFLICVVVIAIGLTRAGVTDGVAHLYRVAPLPLPTVGMTAALGSAVLNNHPMALLNLIAVDAAGGDPHLVLAGLVGGDLGPRLLPIGSLAGLLWLDILRRHDVKVGLRAFVRYGIAVTIPSLIASLGMLWLVTRF